MTEYVYLDGMPVIKISGGQEPSAAMCWDMENSGSCITGLWEKGSMGYDNTQIYQDTTHVKSSTYAEKMHVDTGYTGRILTGWLGITKTQIESTHRYLDFWIYSSTANNVKAYAEVKYDSTCGTSEHVTIFDSTNAVAGWNHVNVDLLAVVEYVEENFDPYVDIQLKVENWNDNTIWLDDVNLSQISSLESVTYLYPDHLGTAISANFDYLPFGDIYQGTPESNLRFPGQYQDRVNLYQNGFRDYNPKIGRYMEADPIGLFSGVNLYSYVGNNPVNWIDPFGLIGQPPIPVPGGGPNNGWKWNPNPHNSRGGSWGPTQPIKGQGQPSASWDPEGHWDVDNGLGDRQRYDESGKPITPEKAHDKGKRCPDTNTDGGDSNTSKSVATGAAVVAGGYLVYRGVRMLPSLLPALWWTIPINAVAP